MIKDLRSQLPIQNKLKLVPPNMLMMTPQPLDQSEAEAPHTSCRCLGSVCVFVCACVCDNNTV